MSKTTFVELNAVDRELIKQALYHWTNVVCDEGTLSGDFANLAAEDLVSRIQQDNTDRVNKAYEDMSGNHRARATTRANARVVNGHHRAAAVPSQ